MPADLSKYEAAGNDFILIEQEGPLSHESVQKLCHRQYGLGADGALTYSKIGSGRWRMVIYNCDGTRATMCGNALRCLSAHLWRTGREAGAHLIVSDRGEHEMQTAPAGVAGHEQPGELYWVKSSMGYEHPAQLDRSDLDLALSRAWIDPKQVRHIDWIDTGVPHLLLSCLEPTPHDIAQLGRFWRWHPQLQPEGANISVAIWDLHHGVIDLSTYERGVEAPTLACGTAACAAAIARWVRHPQPRLLRVQFSGQLPLFLEYDEQAGEEELFLAPSALPSAHSLTTEVKERADRIALRVHLTGPARWVFDAHPAHHLWATGHSL